MFRSNRSLSGPCNLRCLQLSKVLVTKRSWQRDYLWANFHIQHDNRAVNDPIVNTSETKSLAVYDTTDASTSKINSVNKASSSSVTPYSNTSPLSEDEIRLAEFLKVHRFRSYQIVVFLISIVSYLADITSDAYLVYTYYIQENYYWSTLTMVLMIVPALLMSSFSLTWYFIDYKVRVDPPRSCRAWTFRLLFHGLQLAPLVRSADAIYYGIASRQPGLSLRAAAQYTQLMLFEDADCAMLRMIECFTESAPQLLLQLYIILLQPYPAPKFQMTAQFVSCVFSWFSLAWSLTYYQSALRSSRIEKANIRSLGVISFLFWKAGVLMSRLLALGILAAVIKGLWFALALGIHWLLASGWLVTRGTTFCSSDSRALEELAFDFVLGAVYCFDVVNIREGRSRQWYVSCYLILGVENSLCASLWWLTHSSVSNSLSNNVFKNQPSTWASVFPSYTLFIIVICSFFFGIVMMIVYYTAFHPSGNIELCIRCDELVMTSKQHDPLFSNPNTQLSEKTIQLPM
ncbi:XK-related protein [Schistosoma japonicum]|uniref:XK-related protein n=1 Tax=Schistosoma japonicum TaxID=6182 RepID=C1LDV9_SCHJA|nr:XK-related protein [Schistosoma japonicum]CAX72887.1 XK-related protein [Schistosoma japonicum]